MELFFFLSILVLNTFIDRNTSLKVVLSNHFMLLEAKIILLALWFGIIIYFTNSEWLEER